MVDIKTIAIFILVVIILFFIFQRFSRKADGITGVLDAKEKTYISNNDMGIDISNDTTPVYDYSYSIWTYVLDWNYNYGSTKSIFKREGLEVFYSKHQNDLIIKMDTNNSSGEKTEPFECGVTNIPIQKWTNIIISVYGKALDVYINGKLVKTCVMQNIPTSPKGQGVTLSDNNGFSGYTSRFKYMNTPMDPQTAWNIYKKGWDESNLFNLGYDVDVVVTKDGKVIF